MVIKEFSINELVEVISTTPSLFLCGNGLSLNFDSNYSISRLGDRLFRTHLDVIRLYDYDVVSNPNYKHILESNFNAVLLYMRSITSERAFTEIFAGAVSFAKSIILNSSVVEWINSQGYNEALTFGLCPLDLVYAIVDQAMNKGTLYVNYEYWTVLLYYCISLTEVPADIFELNMNNPFVNIVLIGGTFSSIDKKLDGINIYGQVSINGFFTYLRFLLASNILLDGKSYATTELENWSNINKDKLKAFLSKFQNLITTNYDQLLEVITGSSVDHLHGAYSIDRLRVMSQSLGIMYNSVRYDISTIIIGDYFLSKSFLQVTSKISSKQIQNSKIEIYADILRKTLVDTKNETVVIFGLNIDNDYHILRDIQLFLEEGGARNPLIIYCYYSDADRESFFSAYNDCITYSKEVSDFVKNNIRVSTCRSLSLLPEIL